jgi:hypothetical protein
MKPEHREEIRTAVALAVDDASAFFERGSLIRNCISWRWMRWDLCSPALGGEFMCRLLSYLKHVHIDTVLIRALKELQHERLRGR